MTYKPNSKCKELHQHRQYSERSTKYELTWRGIYPILTLHAYLGAVESDGLVSPLPLPSSGNSLLRTRTDTPHAVSKIARRRLNPPTGTNSFPQKPSQNQTSTVSMILVDELLHSSLKIHISMLAGRKENDSPLWLPALFTLVHLVEAGLLQLLQL